MTMPVSKYFKGHGSKVMTNMQKEYGAKKGTRVFYATANKTGMTAPASAAPELAGVRFNVSSGPSTVSSRLPKGVSQSPSGDIGQHRQVEAKLAGGFAGPILSASKYFKGL